MIEYRFTLPGPPRTKKAHNQGVVVRNKRTGKLQSMVFPSANWRKWLTACRRYFVTHQALALALDRDVNCAALFYRDKAIGDSHGFYQGLADVLEECAVVMNDRRIVQWDGSRLLKDAENPRVEVTLTVLEAVPAPAVPSRPSRSRVGVRVPWHTLPSSLFPDDVPE
jgi:hypothetical protein